MAERYKTTKRRIPLRRKLSKASGEQAKQKEGDFFTRFMKGLAIFGSVYAIGGGFTK